MARALLIFLLLLWPLSAGARPIDDFNTAITYFEYEKARVIANTLPPPERELSLAEVAARTDRLDVSYQQLASLDPSTLPSDLVPKYLLVRALQAQAQRRVGEAQRREATQRFVRDGLRQATTPYDRAAFLLLQLRQRGGASADQLETTSLELAEVEGVDDFLVLQAQAIVAARRNRRAEAAALYRALARMAGEEGHQSARLLMSSEALDHTFPQPETDVREALLQGAFVLQDAETAHEIWRSWRRRASEAQLDQMTSATLERVLNLPDSPAKLDFLADLLSQLSDQESLRVAIRAEKIARSLKEPAIALYLGQFTLDNLDPEERDRALEQGCIQLSQLPREGLESSWYGDVVAMLEPRDPVSDSWTLPRLEERLSQSADPRERNQAFAASFSSAYRNRDAQLLERAFLGGLQDAVQADSEERRELVSRLRREFLGGAITEGPAWPNESPLKEAMRSAVLRKLAARPELLQAVLDSLREDTPAQPRRLAAYLQNLSWWLRAGGRLDEARELLEQAAELPDASRDETRIPETLAYLRLQQGDSEGLRMLEKLAPMSDRGSWPATVLGLLYLERGETAQAERWLSQAVSQLPNDPVRLRYNMWARRLLALTFSGQGRPDFALEELQMAAREEEELPEGNIYRDGGRIRRLINARVLLQDGHPEQAAELLSPETPAISFIGAFELDLRRDLARATNDPAIEDQIAEFLSRPTSLPDDPDFQSAWRSALLHQPLPASPPPPRPLLTLSELVENLERLRRREPRARELRGLAAAELKAWMDGAAPDEVLVQPILLDHSVLLLSLRSKGATIEEIFCDRGRLDKALATVEQTCASPDSSMTAAQPAFHYLAERLVWPWLGEDARRVRWLGRGSLARLPLIALPGPDGRPILETLEVTVLDGPAQTATKLGPDPHVLLIDGASDLLGAGDELKAVRRLFPKGERWRLGEDRARLRKLVAAHPIVHISTHGLTPGKANLAGQLQGDGNSLSAFQLAELTLPRGSLAVLAACESSVDAATGRDNSSLVSALRTAGAAQVIGSLWLLDDAVTAQLFERFYQSLHGGATPASALIQAQRSVAAAHPHPYFWAGLQLVTGP